MKAIEYAEQFKKTFKTDEFKAVSDLVLGLFHEGKDIIYERHSERNSSIISVLKEQNLKWKACCNIINKGKEVLNLNGFELWIKEKMGIEI